MGFSGPIGLKGIKILADLSIKNIHNGVAGANKKDFHLKNVNPGRDFPVDEFLDLSYPEEGDGCPRCKGKLVLKRGLELGHIFKLGTRYSESLGAKFLDKKGETKLAIMGCYGIGVTRAMASIVEQNHDEDGIIWPNEVAPFNVLILAIDTANNRVAEKCEELYNKLVEKGFSILLDDRPIRPGVKFKDADLIGIPIRINIGQKSIESEKIELRLRKDKKTMLLTQEELFQYLNKALIRVKNSIK
jgi:prolyl-tRNA synthetase